jgi:hypothetical protein
MVKIILTIFFMLHGLVYLLYASQSLRLFELQPGMTWPDGSWAFSNLIGIKATRWLAAVSCIVSTLGFITGCLGIILKWMWWSNAVVYSAFFSSLFFIFLWDGRIKKLDDQGGIGILINLAIIMSLSFFHWPDFGF